MPCADATVPSGRLPTGLAWLAGKLYVADTNNHALRRVDLGVGTVETVAVK